jgi:hypothetical protein
MVDLDDLEWTRGCEPSRHGRCSLHDFGFAPSFGAFVKVDVLETSFDRPAMWRL